MELQRRRALFVGPLVPVRRHDRARLLEPEDLPLRVAELGEQAPSTAVTTAVEMPRFIAVNAREAITLTCPLLNITRQDVCEREGGGDHSDT